MNDSRKRNVSPVRLLVILAAFSVGLSTGLRPVTDPDLGWQLSGGKWIVSHLNQAPALNLKSIQRAVPSYDFINTFNTSWHDYSWLAQIVLYRIYENSGLDGLRVFIALMIGLLCVILADTAFAVDDRKTYPLITAGTVLAASFLVRDGNSIRPQLFSMIFTSAALGVLIKEKRYELPMLLLLSVILVNMHVYWILIPALWGAFRCMPRFLCKTPPSAPYAWGGLLLLSSAGLFTPYALFSADPLHNWPGNYALILEYLRFPPDIKSTIYELYSPFTLNDYRPWIILFYLIAAVRVMDLKSLVSSSAAVGITVTGFAGFVLGFSAVRFLPLFAIFTLPFMVRSLNTLFKEVKLLGTKFVSRAVNFFSAAVAVIFGLKFMVEFPPFNPKNEVFLDLFPVKACRLIPHLNLKPNLKIGHIRVLTHFDHGGWCRFAAYEEDPAFDMRVTTDGRTQYPGPQFEIFPKIYGVKENWLKLIQQWNPDLILVERRFALGHVLPYLPALWKNTYRDENFALYINRRSQSDSIR